jgi:hypothetical protein
VANPGPSDATVCSRGHRACDQGKHGEPQQRHRKRRHERRRGQQSRCTPIKALVHYDRRVFFDARLKRH